MKGLFHLGTRCTRGRQGQRSEILGGAPFGKDPLLPVEFQMFLSYHQTRKNLGNKAHVLIISGKRLKEEFLFILFPVFYFKL